MQATTPNGRAIKRGRAKITWPLAKNREEGKEEILSTERLPVDINDMANFT